MVQGMYYTICNYARKVWRNKAFRALSCIRLMTQINEHMAKKLWHNFNFGKYGGRFSGEILYLWGYNQGLRVGAVNIPTIRFYMLKQSKMPLYVHLVHAVCGHFIESLRSYTGPRYFTAYMCHGMDAESIPAAITGAYRGSTGSIRTARGSSRQRHPTGLYHRHSKIKGHEILSLCHGSDRQSSG